MWIQAQTGLGAEEEEEEEKWGEEEEEEMGGCYTPTAFPLTCVGGRAGSGLRGVPAAPG